MKVITNDSTIDLGNNYQIKKPDERGRLRYVKDGKGASITGVSDVNAGYDAIISAILAGKDHVDLRDEPDADADDEDAAEDKPKPKRKPRTKAAETKTEVVEDTPPETTA